MWLHLYWVPLSEEAVCAHAGVLVLSEFAGAAQSLGAGAILVNPWNITDMAAAIEDALTMSDQAREGCPPALQQCRPCGRLAWQCHASTHGSCHAPLQNTLTVRYPSLDRQTHVNIVASWVGSGEYWVVPGRVGHNHLHSARHGSGSAGQQRAASGCPGPAMHGGRGAAAACTADGVRARCRSGASGTGRTSCT